MPNPSRDLLLGTLMTLVLLYLVIIIGATEPGRMRQAAATTACPTG